MTSLLSAQVGFVLIRSELNKNAEIVVLFRAFVIACREVGKGREL